MTDLAKGEAVCMGHCGACDTKHRDLDKQMDQLTQQLETKSRRCAEVEREWDKSCDALLGYRMQLGAAESKVSQQAQTIAELRAALGKYVGVRDAWGEYSAAPAIHPPTSRAERKTPNEDETRI